MRKIILVMLIVTSTVAYGQSNAVIAPCPSIVMPIIEVRVNNTASSDDDYGSTSSYTVCTARIVNYAGGSGSHIYSGGIPIELQNPFGSTQNLLFSSTGGTSAGSASLFKTLPEDGSLLTFYIKGKKLDATDKASIIEVETTWSSCSAVVIARKALMIGTSPVTAGVPHVEVEINSVSTIDDYVTWSPTLCRIRWSNAAQRPLITYNNSPFQQVSYNESSTSFGTNSTLTVELRNMVGTDRLRFASASLSKGTTAKNTILDLTLSSDGSWMYFYIAGNYGQASVNDKDAIIGIKDLNTDNVLAREAVMVRIRKNANNLTTAEKSRYLQALKVENLTYKFYTNFLKTHARDNTGAVLSAVASRQSHKGSAFLPWHRTFILEFERQLQAADPSVSLPYWKFDVAAPNVLNSNFMGSNSTTSSNMAVFASSNSLRSWTLAGENVPTGVQRKTPYTSSSGHPNTATETATLALGGSNSAYSGFRNMENTFHSPAHSGSGSVSWISTLVNAVRDPLFFLLHSNVDHVWAKWQWMHNRYTSSDVLAYDLQGTYNSPPSGLGPDVTANRTLGQYVGDTMWPWDNGTGGTSGSPSERPHIAVLTPFPLGFMGSKPLNRPTPGGAVDYLGITSNTPDSGMGFCYDDFYPY